MSHDPLPGLLRSFNLTTMAGIYAATMKSAEADHSLTPTRSTGNWAPRPKPPRTRRWQKNIPSCVPCPSVPGGPLSGARAAGRRKHIYRKQFTPARSARRAA